MRRRRRYTVSDLLAIMRRLRGPRGCPWDRKQTHASLCGHLVEETYEFVDAVRSRSADRMAEELGDLLLHIVFQSEIGRGKGEFTFDEVVDGICRKLVRRHPHVFGDRKVRDADEVVRNWKLLKQQEKPERRSAMDRIPRSLPALPRAEHILRTAYHEGFRWPSSADLVAKVREELDELLAELRRPKPSRRAVAEELGDLLFVLVNLGLDLGLSAEDCLRLSSDKFLRRFRRLERLCRRGKLAMADADPAALRRLWDRTKAKTRRRP